MNVCQCNEKLMSTMTMRMNMGHSFGTNSENYCTTPSKSNSGQQNNSNMTSESFLGLMNIFYSSEYYIQKRKLFCCYTFVSLYSVQPAHFLTTLKISFVRHQFLSLCAEHTNNRGPISLIVVSVRGRSDYISATVPVTTPCQQPITQGNKRSALCLVRNHDLATKNGSIHGVHVCLCV